MNNHIDDFFSLGSSRKKKLNQKIYLFKDMIKPYKLSESKYSILVRSIPDEMSESLEKASYYECRKIYQKYIDAFLVADIIEELDKEMSNVTLWDRLSEKV